MDLRDIAGLVEYAKECDIANDPLVVDLVAAVENLVRIIKAYES